MTVDGTKEDGRTAGRNDGGMGGRKTVGTEDGWMGGRLTEDGKTVGRTTVGSRKDGLSADGCAEKDSIHPFLHFRQNSFDSLLRT